MLSYSRNSLPFTVFWYSLSHLQGPATSATLVQFKFSPYFLILIFHYTVIILSCIQKHPVQFLAAHNLSWLRFLAFFSLSSWMWGQYLSYSFIKYYNGKIMTVPHNFLKFLKNPFKVWAICSITEWTKNKIKSIFVLSFHPYLGVQSNFLTDILYVYFIPAA